MLLIHQTFVTFTKSQKYFCMQWRKFIQKSQSLLRFILNILFWGPHTQLSAQSGLKLET